MMRVGENSSRKEFTTKGFDCKIQRFFSQESIVDESLGIYSFRGM
jgi:hypothetical protein